MELKIIMVIFSHLSDASLLTSIGEKEKAINHINFTKVLLNRYPNTESYVHLAELDSMWDKMINN